MSDLATVLAGIPDDQVEEELERIAEKLGDEFDLDEILHDFFGYWARPDQQIPPGNWNVWMIRSGRGAGKTRTGSEWTNKMANDFPGCHIALVGQTVSDVRDVMVSGDGGGSAILETAPPWFRPSYVPSRRKLVWPNGSVATTYSGDKPDQLRGPQHHFAWVDELAKFEKPTETWNQLEMGLRLGIHPRCLVTTTPRPINIIRQLDKDPSCHVTVVSTFANRANLASTFIDRVTKKYSNTTMGRQELEGDILDDINGALWTRARLEATRVFKLPPLEIVKVVVGVDPAMTGDEGSNETGIVVACRTADDHYYVLEDRSGRYSPDGWARQVALLAYEYQAEVVGEVNQGGDLVEAVIRNADRNLKLLPGNDKSRTLMVKQVRATRGKRMRAEPVSMLWEQGRAHMVGVHPTLEDQLCTFTGIEEEEVENDRLDAMVWAITRLKNFSEINVL